MAKVQTRRTISFSKVAHDAATTLANRIGISVSELATRALRDYGAAIPETHHAGPPASCVAHKRKQTRSMRSGSRPAVKRLVKRRPKPVAKVANLPTRRPSADQLAALLAECERKVPMNGSRGEMALVESHKRKVSLLFGDELRKRGWLAEEGYAPGSWADPKNAKGPANA